MSSGKTPQKIDVSDYFLRRVTKGVTGINQIGNKLMIVSYSFYWRFEMYQVGEKPGKGRYCCTECDWVVVLDDNDDRLPPCGKCGKGQNTTYKKC